VMTALIAIESGRLDETVTIPKEAVGVEGSSLYLEEGEQFALKDLLYGLMMHSGNDSAEAIAIFISGSVEAFCIKMNERAKELGAKSTNFVNPHGLPAKGHVTSANRLAIISAAAMGNDVFCEIVSTKYHEMIPRGAGTKRTLKNKNKLLWNYESATGVKTGYTKEAGKCLVASSARDRLEVVTVVLNCPNMWDDTVRLLDFAHEQYWLCQIAIKDEVVTEAKVENGRAETVKVQIKENLYYPLKVDGTEKPEVKIDLPTNITAPIKAGQEMGTIRYYIGEELAGESKLVAAEDVEALSFLDRLWRFLSSIF